jgi:hypothetical protein
VEQTLAGGDGFEVVREFDELAESSPPGVGRAASGAWATLLTPNVFLSATHYRPAIGSTVTFYPGNDPSATALGRTVAGGQQIAGSDLATIADLAVSQNLNPRPRSGQQERIENIITRVR